MGAGPPPRVGVHGPHDPGPGHPPNINTVFWFPIKQALSSVSHFAQGGASAQRALRFLLYLDKPTVTRGSHLEASQGVL